MTSFIARRTRPTMLTAFCLIVVGLVVNVAAASADPVDLKGGYTTVTRAPIVEQALAANGLMVLPLRPATTGTTTWNGQPTSWCKFPVTGGVIEPGTLAGEIGHSGGLVFINTKNGATLETRDFRIDTTAGKLLGRVGDNYVPLLDLDLSAAKVSARGACIRVDDVGLAFTEAAADALNATLDTDLFAAGLPLGKAKVTLRLPWYGYTALSLNPGIPGVLVDSGVTVLPVDPAQVWTVPMLPTPPAMELSGYPLTFAFPITKLDIDPDSLGGLIWHSGGLVFYNIENGKKLTATRFRIDTINAVVTACVKNSRVPLLSLDLSGIQLGAQGPYATVGNVKASLTEIAAGALNASLATDIFAPGLELGTATVVVRL